MQLPRQHKQSRFAFFITLTLGMLAGVGGMYYTTQLRQKAEADSAAAGQLTSYAKIVKQDGDSFTIPTTQWFQRGNMWQLVSKTSTLPTDYIPNLTPIASSKSSDTGNIDASIARPLANFIAAGAKSGHELTIASAYRSAADQQKLYDLYTTTRGQAFTVEHVALPGTSEHQTGMAVDISTLTNGCLKDSDTCTLQPQDIAWVQKNAPRFGFVQRYPSGKQSITGISGEEWHYRYVGVALAQFLTKHDLTLDEFVAQAK